MQFENITQDQWQAFLANLVKAGATTSQTASGVNVIYPVVADGIVSGVGVAEVQYVGTTVTVTIVAHPPSTSESAIEAVFSQAMAS